MTQDFPFALEDIDAEWLTRLLHAAGTIPADARVDAFAVSPIGSGFGQTGESVRLLPNYVPAGSGPDSIFAKFATADANRRRASQSLDLYRREVDFYLRLAPQTAIRVPDCYFAAASPDGDRATLLLEDFPAHRAGDDLIGLQPDEALAAIDLLADLHAPFWGRGDRMGVAPLRMGDPPRFEAAWTEMERAFGDILPPALSGLRERYIAAIEPLHLWVIGGDAPTIGHGDLKLDNILFGRDTADPIVAIDWQAVRPQRGIRDVAYLVSHSMDVALRRAHEDALIARYCTALSERGVTYAEETARAEYPVAMLYDFTTVLYITGVNLNSNERAIRRKRALIERATTALFDWDAFACLDRLSPTGALQ